MTSTITANHRSTIIIIITNLLLLLLRIRRLECVDLFTDYPPIRVEDGNSDYYANVVLNSDLAFIDKSLFVDEYLKHPARVLLINRPPKWGKTVNLRTLKKFLEVEVDVNGDLLPIEQRINRRYFVGGTVRAYSDQPSALKPAKIAQKEFSMKRQGEFPVVCLNLAATVIGGCDNYDEIEQRLRSEIEEMFTEHLFLERYLDDDENTTSNNVLNAFERRKLDAIVSGRYETEDLKDSLRFLTELLFVHYKRKVHVLIDDYDAPITLLFFRTYNRLKSSADENVNEELLLDSQMLQKIFDSTDLKRTVELFADLYRNCLQDNDALEKALLTGTARIAKADPLLGMHHIKEYTLMDEEFSRFYGFDQDEVDLLIDSSAISNDTKRDELAAWYGGYISAGGRLLYNVWSITQCLLEKGRLDVYNSGNFPKRLIDQVGSDVKKKLDELTNGKTIVVVVNKHIAFKEGIGPELFNLLTVTGNLTPKNFTGKGLHYMCEMTVPNLEVKHLYLKNNN